MVPVRGRPAGERLEDALAPGPGYQAPVGHMQENLAVLRCCTQCDSLVGPENLRAFSITLTRALELGRVDLDRRNVARKVHVDATLIRRDHVERTRNEPVDRPELARRSRSAGLESRELQKIGNESVESLHLGEDHGNDSSRSSSEVVELTEHFARSRDRGDRRSEVMADRTQDRRLDRVAAAQGSASTASRWRRSRLPAPPPSHAPPRADAAPPPCGVARSRRAHADRRDEVDGERHQFSESASLKVWVGGRRAS
jgi:hypothetical protein